MIIDLSNKSEKRHSTSRHTLTISTTGSANFSSFRVVGRRGSSWFFEVSFILEMNFESIALLAANLAIGDFCGDDGLGVDDIAA